MTLLDMHTFVWLASDQKELSAKADAAIRRDLDSLFISVVTAWEIALLYKKRSFASCIASSGVCGTGDPASWCARTPSHPPSFNGKRLAAGYPQRSLRPNFGGRGSSTQMPACIQRSKNSALSRSGDDLVSWKWMPSGHLVSVRVVRRSIALDRAMSRIEKLPRAAFQVYHPPKCVPFLYLRGTPRSTRAAGWRTWAAERTTPRSVRRWPRAVRWPG